MSPISLKDQNKVRFVVLIFICTKKKVRNEGRKEVLSCEKDVSNVLLSCVNLMPAKDTKTKM